MSHLARWYADRAELRELRYAISNLFPPAQDAPLQADQSIYEDSLTYIAMQLAFQIPPETRAEYHRLQNRIEDIEARHGIGTFIEAAFLDGFEGSARFIQKSIGKNAHSNSRSQNN